MAFQSTSRKITISNNMLSAECRDWDKNWCRSSINLNNYIGNSDGVFSLSEHNFTSSASNVHLKGTMLCASLRKRDGSWCDAVMNLNLCITNKNGSLQYQQPKESMLNCGSCYRLQGSVLHGLCMRYDGRHAHSTINLNDHYGNDNGDFKSGDNHFYYTARNVTFTISNSSLMLNAELKGNHWYSGDFWHADATDLVTNIVIREGRFIFEKHDGLFDRDGAFTKLFERVPFVGFVVAGIHELAGNEEHAKRAVALCANSSIVCGGILIGSFLGGPLGGAIGAGLTTPLGILVETQIAGTITDPQLQAQFEEATLGRYIYETLRNTLAAGAAGYLAEFLSAQAGEITVAGLQDIAKQFLPGPTGIVSEFSAYWLLKKIADAIKHSQLPEEWIQTEKKVKALKNNA